MTAAPRTINTPEIERTPWAVWPGLVFLCLAFVTSLFFEGYADLSYAPAALLLYFGAGCLFLSGIKSGTRLPASTSALLFYGFCAYITISVWWSSVPFSSLITFLVFSSLPVAFLAAGAIAKHRAALTGVFYAVIGILTALGGWAVVQYLFLQDIYGTRAHHPLPNANNLASLLNLGLLPALALTISRVKIDRYFGIGLAASALLFGGVLATGSRGGLIVAVISLAVLCYVLRAHISANKHGFTLCAVLGLALFTLFQFIGGAPVAERLAQLFSPLADPNTLARLSLWEQGLIMFRDFGLTGTGLGTFYLYYPPYREPLIDNSAGYWLHMDALQYGIETGFAATVLFYATLGAIFGRTVKAIKSCPEISGRRVMTAGIFCGLLTVVLHAHISFPLYVMPILIVCGLWWATLYTYTEKEPETDRETAKEAPPPSRGQFAASAMLTVLVLGLLSLMTVSSATGQIYLKNAIEAIRQGRVSTFVENIEKAQIWGPGSFIDPQVQLVGLYIDLLGSGAILFSEDEQKKMLEDSLAILEEAENLNPVWAEIDYKRGRLHEAILLREQRQGTVSAERRQTLTEKIISSWRAGLEKNPMHHKTRLALARALIRAGRPAKAYDTLVTGLQYPTPRDKQHDYTTLVRSVEDLATIQKAYKIRGQKIRGGKNTRPKTDMPEEQEKPEKNE